MEAAIIYAAMPWTATLLVIVHRVEEKQIKEARVQTALRVYTRHALRSKFDLLWPDGTRS